MVGPTMLSQFRHCHFADCLGVSSLDLGRVNTRPFFWEPCVMKIKSIRSANRHREGDKQLLVSKLLDKLAPSKELVPKPAFGTSSPKPAVSRRGTSPARLRAKSPGYSSDTSQLTPSQRRLLTSPARLKPKSRTSTPKEKGFGSGAVSASHCSLLPLCRGCPITLTSARTVSSHSLGFR